MLYKSGVNVRGYYSLANYYYQNRPEYIDSLNLVQMRGETDLTPFVAFAPVWYRSWRSSIEKCWMKSGQLPSGTMPGKA